MQFLKLLIACLLAFVVAAYTLANWTWVPVRLPGDLIAETNLPFLTLVAFLLGAVPVWLYQRTVRWRLRQRLAIAERQLAELRALPVAPEPPVPSAVEPLP